MLQIKTGTLFYVLRNKIFKWIKTYGLFEYIQLARNESSMEWIDSASHKKTYRVCFMTRSLKCLRTRLIVDESVESILVCCENQTATVKWTIPQWRHLLDIFSSKTITKLHSLYSNTRIINWFGPNSGKWFLWRMSLLAFQLWSLWLPLNRV